MLRDFRDDFAKYRRRVPLQRLDETFRSVAMQTGSRFVCASVSPETKSTAILAALFLLEKAGPLPDVRILPLYAVHRLHALIEREG